MPTTASILCNGTATCRASRYNIHSEIKKVNVLVLTRPSLEGLLADVWTTNAVIALDEKHILATENMSGMTVPHVVLISRVGTKKDRANYSLPLKY